MYRTLLFLTALVGLSGCSRESKLERSGVGVRFPETRWSIAQTSEGKWKVGQHLTSTVSKNLNVVLRLPLISDQDAEFLMSTYRVDSWVVRVRQEAANNQQQELAVLWAPFRSRSGGRAGGLPTKALSLNLTYSAYAISERLRNQRCPEFSHNRRLKEWEVSGDATPLEVVLTPRGSYTEKLTLSELVPTSLNIGASMVGRFVFEVALYSTRDKQLFSEFRPIPQSIHVLREETVAVDGCP